MKTIFLGNYWQSDDGKKEPIEWVVLKEESDSIYLLSKNCLDCVPYSDGHQIAWKNCLMRKWLNEYFINEAFSAEEQERIILSDVRTSSGWCGPDFSEWGNPVKDKIFLPSIHEAILYFGGKEWHDIDAEQKRIACSTNYAYEKGCDAYRLQYGIITRNRWGAFDEKKSYWQVEESPTASDFFIKDGEYIQNGLSKIYFSSCWFLRSSGCYILYVSADGEIDEDGHKFSGIGVRPAMWVKKEFVK